MASATVTVSPPEWRAWPVGAKANAVAALIEAGAVVLASVDVLAAVVPTGADPEPLREMVRRHAPDARGAVE